MERTILIAGCGYVGLALSRHFSAQGTTVLGLRRSAAKAGELRAAGADPVIADLTDPATLTSLPAADYVVACQAPGRGPSVNYRATYLEGTRNLVRAMAARPPKRMVVISSTRVYGDAEGGWVDEATPAHPASEEGRILLEAEAVALAAPFPVIVLRLGGIYGPGKDRLSILRSGGPPDLTGYINQVHVDDVVGMIVCLFARGTPGDVYLGVDDAPALKADCYAWVAERAGIAWLPASRPAPGATEGKRCSNRKIRALGYAFCFPDYRAGFSSVLGARPT